MDHIFRPGDLCLVFCSRRWYNKCKALPAVLDISHFPFSLLTVQCISTYEFRQWQSSKGGHGIARASIKTWETCRVWKNRNCLSNKSLSCCCCKKWTQCPWITECYPAGLHPAVFTISTISKHVTWHFNLDYEAVMFVIKFTCRQINQTILSFFSSSSYFGICKHLVGHIAVQMEDGFRSVTSACRPAWCNQVPITFPY